MGGAIPPDAKQYAIPRASGEWLFAEWVIQATTTMSRQQTNFLTIRRAHCAVLLGLSLFFALRADAEEPTVAPGAAAAQPADAAPVAAAQPSAASATQAETDRFDILEYQVSGNSVLPVAYIEEAVYPFLGEKKTIADVELARAALEKVYQDAGYLTVFVNLPEQQVTAGVVRLEVREGTVERLRVTGSRYYALGAIKAKAPALEEGGVPNFKDVQKELAGLNRSQGRRVTPVLRAGRIPGTVEAELKVEDRLPLHASVEVNDRYSRDTTKTRLSASVRYDNLWQSEHSLNLNFQTAPENPDESKVLVATYVAPLASGNTVAAYAVASDTDVTTVGGISSLGKGTILGLRYVIPLRPLPGVFHSLTLGADYKDYADTQRFLGQDNNLPITYLPFSAAYDLTLAGERSQTQIGLSTVFSLRDVVSDTAEFEAKRTGGKANFMLFKADLRQVYKLPRGMLASGKISTQYSASPLISNEQMAAGGADSVRGYPESAALGDKGWRAGLELQGPPMTGAWAPVLDELYVLGFAEGAHLEYLEAGAAQESSFNLASAGIGLRFRAGKKFSGGVDYARALKDAGGVNSGDERIHFRLGAEW